MSWTKIPEVNPVAVQRALYGERPAIDDLLACATRHGEVDDPDHEVGDLQDLLRACWEVMSEKQRAKASAPWLETMRDVLDCTDPEEG